MAHGRLCNKVLVWAFASAFLFCNKTFFIEAKNESTAEKRSAAEAPEKNAGELA